MSAPDAEGPTDTGGNNVYDVQVQVSDGSNTDTQDIAVTVTNVNDNAPVVTSNGGGATAAVDFAENGTAVTTVTASDADAGASQTYSITGGADAAKFAINTSTGALTCVSAPDFEIPTDTGGNNVYDVQVQVSDGSNTDTQDIAVTVTNVSGSFTGTPGDDTITGSSEEDSITALGGNDTLTGGLGADTIDGGLGADTFVVGAIVDLAAGETIDGIEEAGTTDTLRLDAAGTYNLSTFSTITNIDAIDFNVNASGFNLTVADSQASTADANGDGTKNDLRIRASVAMTNGVTINAAGLTGSNRITVVGTNLAGADIITGGAGADTIDGGAGIDTITGGAGADTITGGSGADVLTGGTGADTFVIGAVADLAAGETINGTAEAGTIDTLRLDAAGAYDLSTFSTLTNIDDVAFNVDAAGFNLTIADSQVSTADANGDGTQNDLRISASVAMTNGVTINAAGLTGSNGITVIGTNLTGADIITGGAGVDTIDGGAGADTITGGAGADVLTGGTGADTFIIGAVAHLAAGETINGTAEAGTIDALQLDAAGTYNLSTFTTITNIDAVAFNVNASGFNLTVANSQVSTADANGDGTQNDLQIGASVAMTNGVTINASGLTGTNRITVVGTNLGGADVITGGAGADTIDSGDGADTLTGGTGSDALAGAAGNDSYVFALTDGADTITESGVGTADSIVIQSSGAALSTLDVTDSNTTAAAGNLVIAYNGQQITVTNHFVGGNNVVETLTFSGGGTYAGYSLGTGAYTISTDDSSPRASTAGVNTILAGSTAVETLNGNTGNDLIFGGDSGDTINGGDGVDLLVGDAGNDGINGGTSSDWLVGGAGADTLTGGGGADHFVFMATTDGTNSITDFSSGQGDTIDILVSAFGGGLTTGTDPETVFGSSIFNAFTSSTERFHFNILTSTLFYDADGDEDGSAAVTLATFGLLELTFSGSDLHFI